MSEPSEAAIKAAWAVFTPLDDYRGIPTIAAALDAFAAQAVEAERTEWNKVFDAASSQWKASLEQAFKNINRLLEKK